MPSPTNFTGFTHDVIFIDAIPGSGKSLLGPIVSSFSNVERQTMGLFTIEHLIAATYLDLCDTTLAQQLIQQIVSVNHYNSFIGRNINMKLNDLSGPLTNPHRLKYIFRLFCGSRGFDHDIDLINDLNIAPLIKIHGCAYNVRLLRQSFPKRLKFIELVRHPLDTIKSWINAQNYYRHGKRGFSLRLNQDKVVFDYLRDLNNPDLCPLRQYNQLFGSIRNSFDAYLSDFLLLPFEYFLADSSLCISALTNFLDRKPIDRQLRWSLYQQKCNRYKLIQSQSTCKNQLHLGEPMSLVDLRNHTLSTLYTKFESSDLEIFVDHVYWYKNYFTSFHSITN